MASAICVKRMLALSGFMFTRSLLHVRFSTRNKTRGKGLLWRRFVLVQLRPMEVEADALGLDDGALQPQVVLAIEIAQGPRATVGNTTSAHPHPPLTPGRVRLCLNTCGR